MDQPADQPQERPTQMEEPTVQRAEPAMEETPMERPAALPASDQPAVQPEEQLTETPMEEAGQLTQQAMETPIEAAAAQPAEESADEPDEEPAETIRKPKNPGKSWSDLELRYIWDVVQEQRNEGMTWNACATSMHLAMREQKHVRRRYQGANLLQAWKKYFSAAAKERGTFDYINSAPLNRRPPPRKAPNNSRYVVKSHYRPQQILIATQSRSAANWGYGTNEFEKAVADVKASAVGDDGEDWRSNAGSSIRGTPMRDISMRSTPMRSTPGVLKGISRNNRNEDDDELPGVNELSKKSAGKRTRGSETPVARSLPPRASKDNSKRLVDYDNVSEDSFDEDQTYTPPQKRIKGVIVHSSREMEFEYDDESERPAEPSVSAQTPLPDDQVSVAQKEESVAGDYMKFPPMTAPFPHNVYDVPLGLPHQANVEYPYKAPSIKSDPGIFSVPPLPPPRRKPGPKPWRPDASAFKASPTRAALDAHMRSGTQVEWQEPGKLMTRKQKDAKKREEFFARREARAAAGLRVPKLKTPRKFDVPPPLIPEDFVGNDFTALQNLRNEELWHNYQKDKKEERMYQEMMEDGIMEDNGA